MTRVRTALDGLRRFTLGAAGCRLTLNAEVGGRQDGGDAEIRAGMDIGGALAFRDTATYRCARCWCIPLNALDAATAAAYGWLAGVPTTMPGAEFKFASSAIGKLGRGGPWTVSMVSWVPAQNGGITRESWLAYRH